LGDFWTAYPCGYLVSISGDNGSIIEIPIQKRIKALSRAIVILFLISSSIVFAGPVVVPHPHRDNGVNFRDTHTGVMSNISDVSTITQIQEMFRRSKKIGDTISHLRTYSHNIDFSDRWLVNLETGEIGMLRKKVSDVYQLESEDLKKLKIIIQSNNKTSELSPTASVEYKGQEAKYGKWKRYSKEYFLIYPDLNLHYKGTSLGAFYPGSSTRRMGDEYNFIAESGNHKVDISWSQGTGEIGPVFFTLADKNFVIEMERSEILDQWALDDTLIIWLESEWKSEKERHWFWKMLW
jgi:hypothetical protein